MRYAILAAPTIGRVIGTLQGTESARINLSDRQADGQAFAGERVVRLPRGISRRLYRSCYRYRSQYLAECTAARLFCGEDI